jgi:hypothetical protein
VRYGIDMMWLPGRARRENARILFFLTTHGTYG